MVTTTTTKNDNNNNDNKDGNDNDDDDSNYDTRRDKFKIKMNWNFIQSAFFFLFAKSDSLAKILDTFCSLFTEIAGRNIIIFFSNFESAVKLSDDQQNSEVLGNNFCELSF